MIILGIETSCDETAASICLKSKNRIKILSNIVTSSAPLQAKWGGVIPEQAAREQLKAIIPVIDSAITESGCSIKDIDAIAVTQGPGLIGSLLVGVETAKTLSLIWDKPLIPINHLLGHFYANFVNDSIARFEGNASVSTYSQPAMSDEPTGEELAGENCDTEQYLRIPKFPSLGLLVSGGHSDLVLFKNHGIYEYLGGTRDDAAGECFDKCARLLGLNYPGGSKLAEIAEKGNPKSLNLPRPMINSNDLDFSFSGLKTAVANLLNTSEASAMSSAESVKNCDYTSEVGCDLAASIQEAIVDCLISKLLKALKSHKVKSVMIAGGVGANKRLGEKLNFELLTLNSKLTLYIPPPELCTDNAVMIAAAGFFQKPINSPLNVQANPNLSLSS